MRVTVLRPAELGSPELGQWRVFRRTDPCLRHPFLAPEFALAVGEARDDARVAVVEQDGRVGGFLAYQLAEPAGGEPIGAGICDAQALVHAPALRWDARELIRAVGLRRWRYDHLLTCQRQFAPFHDQVRASPLMDLSGGLERYLDDVRRRSSNVLPQTRRKRRRLERDLGPLTVTWQDTDHRALATLMDWKRAQYRRTGSWDRFAHPWIVRTLRTLAAIRGPGFAGSLLTVRAGGRLVAAHFGLRDEDVLSFWFPAYDPELAGYSPGQVMMLELAEQAAAAGVRLVDLGKGEHGYKLRLRTGEALVAEGAVVADGGAFPGGPAPPGPRRAPDVG